MQCAARFFVYAMAFGTGVILGAEHHGHDAQPVRRDETREQRAPEQHASSNHQAPSSDMPHAHAASVGQAIEHAQDPQVAGNTGSFQWLNRLEGISAPEGDSLEIAPQVAPEDTNSPRATIRAQLSSHFTPLRLKIVGVATAALAIWFKKDAIVAWWRGGKPNNAQAKGNARIEGSGGSGSDSPQEEGDEDEDEESGSERSDSPTTGAGQPSRSNPLSSFLNKATRGGLRALPGNRPPSPYGKTGRGQTLSEDPAIEIGIPACPAPEQLDAESDWFIFPVVVQNPQTAPKNYEHGTPIQDTALREQLRDLFRNHADTSLEELHSAIDDLVRKKYSKAYSWHLTQTMPEGGISTLIWGVKGSLRQWARQWAHSAASKPRLDIYVQQQQMSATSSSSAQSSRGSSREPAEASIENPYSLAVPQELPQQIDGLFAVTDPAQRKAIHERFGNPAHRNLTEIRKAIEGILKPGTRFKIYQRHTRLPLDDQLTLPIMDRATLSGLGAEVYTERDEDLRKPAKTPQAAPEFAAPAGGQRPAASYTISKPEGPEQGQEAEGKLRVAGGSKSGPRLIDTIARDSRGLITETRGFANLCWVIPPQDRRVPDAVTDPTIRNAFLDVLYEARGSETSSMIIQDVARVTRIDANRFQMRIVASDKVVEAVESGESLRDIRERITKRARNKIRAHLELCMDPTAAPAAPHVGPAGSSQNSSSLAGSAGGPQPAASFAGPYTSPRELEQKREAEDKETVSSTLKTDRDGHIAPDQGLASFFRLAPMRNSRTGALEVQNALTDPAKREAALTILCALPPKSALEIAIKNIAKAIGARKRNIAIHRLSHNGASMFSYRLWSIESLENAYYSIFEHHEAGQPKTHFEISLDNPSSVPGWEPFSRKPNELASSAYQESGQTFTPVSNEKFREQFCSFFQSRGVETETWRDIREFVSDALGHDNFIICNINQLSGRPTRIDRPFDQNRQADELAPRYANSNSIEVYVAEGYTK